MGHTPYLQQIVKALIEKRGMSPNKAYAIARAAIRRWMRGGGHVHPEVVAAAGRAEAGEIARQARAKMSHAASWDQVADLIELAVMAPAGGGTRPKPRQGQKQRARPQSNNWQGEQRVPKGQFGGGRFTKGGGGQQAGSKQGKAAKRAKLTREIAGIRAQLATLRAELARATAPHRGKPSKSSTPRKKGAAATSAKQAKQGKQQAKAAAAKTKTSARNPMMSPATIRAKIAALRATLRADLAQLRAL